MTIITKGMGAVLKAVKKGTPARKAKAKALREHRGSKSHSRRVKQYDDYIQEASDIYSSKASTKKSYKANQKKFYSLPEKERNKIWKIKSRRELKGK